MMSSPPSPRHSNGSKTKCGSPWLSRDPKTPPLDNLTHAAPDADPTVSLGDPQTALQIVTEAQTPNAIGAIPFVHQRLSTILFPYPPRVNQQQLPKDPAVYPMHAASFKHSKGQLPRTPDNGKVSVSLFGGPIITMIQNKATVVKYVHVTGHPSHAEMRQRIQKGSDFSRHLTLDRQDYEQHNYHMDAVLENDSDDLKGSVLDKVRKAIEATDVQDMVARFSFAAGKIIVAGGLLASGVYISSKHFLTVAHILFSEATETPTQNGKRLSNEEVLQLNRKASISQYHHVDDSITDDIGWRAAKLVGYLQESDVALFELETGTADYYLEEKSWSSSHCEVLSGYKGPIYAAGYNGADYDIDMTRVDVDEESWKLFQEQGDTKLTFWKYLWYNDWLNLPQDTQTKLQELGLTRTKPADHLGTYLPKYRAVCAGRFEPGEKKELCVSSTDKVYVAPHTVPGFPGSSGSMMFIPTWAEGPPHTKIHLQVIGLFKGSQPRSSVNEMICFSPNLISALMPSSSYPPSANVVPLSPADIAGITMSS